MLKMVADTLIPYEYVIWTLYVRLLLSSGCNNRIPRGIPQGNGSHPLNKDLRHEYSRRADHLSAHHCPCPCIQIWIRGRTYHIPWSSYWIHQVCIKSPVHRAPESSLLREFLVSYARRWWCNNHLEQSKSWGITATGAVRLDVPPLLKAETLLVDSPNRYMPIQTTTPASQIRLDVKARSKEETEQWEANRGPIWQLSSANSPPHQWMLLLRFRFGVDFLVSDEPSAIKYV